MRRTFVLVLALGLLLTATGESLAEGKSRERGRGEDAPASLGSFSTQDASRTVTGKHLSFTWSDAGIAGFRAANRTLFDLVVSDGSDGGEDEEDGRATNVRSDGSTIRVRTANYTFVAHDNPSAVGKLETHGLITITFADGVVLTRSGEESVRFSFGDVQGTLRNDDIRVDGRTATAQDEVLVYLDEARGSFDRRRGDIGDAIEKRHVGVEATFNANDSEEVVEDVVSYGNVTMTTVKAERGNLTVLVDGHGLDGRVIVLNVDGRVLGAQSAQKLNILLDNASMLPASNFSDILDPDDDGYEPEYYIVYDPSAEVFQLVVTVPHYSVHTLSITTFLEVVQPSVVVGVLAGVASCARGAPAVPPQVKRSNRRPPTGDRVARHEESTTMVPPRRRALRGA
jgi:hypothetical protein